MSAPVFDAPISMLAVMTGWSVGSAPCRGLNMLFMKLSPLRRIPIICRKLRSSGWNTIMMAITPTLTIWLRIVDSNSIRSARVTTHTMYMTIMPESM